MNNIEDYLVINGVLGLLLLIVFIIGMVIIEKITSKEEN